MNRGRNDLQKLVMNTGESIPTRPIPLTSRMHGSTCFPGRAGSISLFYSAGGIPECEHSTETRGRIRTEREQRCPYGSQTRVNQGFFFPSSSSSSFSRGHVKEGGGRVLNLYDYVTYTEYIYLFNYLINYYYPPLLMSTVCKSLFKFKRSMSRKAKYISHMTNPANTHHFKPFTVIKGPY